MRLQSAGKVAVGIAIGALATGGIVLADGGDGTLIHACVDSANAQRANTIIVGTNDACPAGFTSMHWGVQGPAGAPGPAGPSGPAGADGGALPQVLVVTKSKGPSLETHKTVEATCPANYTAMGGSAVGTPTRIPGTAKILHYLFEENQPVLVGGPVLGGGRGTLRKQVGWRAKSHAGYFSTKVHTAGDAYRLFNLGSGKWKLTVTVNCLLTG